MSSRSDEIVNGNENAETENKHYPGKGSTGPKTPEGKARSSANAIKTGFYSERIVLANESQEMFDALLASYVAEWEPVGQTETDLVTKLAIHQWRFLRTIGMEAGMLNAEMFIQRPSFDGCYDNTNAQLRHGDAFLCMSKDNPAGTEALSEWENRFSRAYERTVRMLLMLKRIRHAAAPPLPDQQDTKSGANGVSVAPDSPSKPRVLFRLKRCEGRRMLTTATLDEVFAYESSFFLTDKRSTIHRKDWKS